MDPKASFSIDQLRKYRLYLEEPPFLNAKSQGIALFDLLGTFMIAFLLENYITNNLNITRKIYYASLIPLGVIVHWITGQQTFLNSKLLDYNFNIYKVLFLGLILYLVSF